MSAKLFFWNVRGLNDPGKHRNFINWLNSHRPLFGALLETHIKELSLAQLMNTLCRGWNFFSNHLSDEDGRIIIIWKDPVKIRVIAQSRQQITCEVLLPRCTPLIYTAIYASNLSDERTDLWVELLNLHMNLGLDTKPWMIGGDFNQILHPLEHSDLNDNASTSNIYQFRDCLLQLGAFDLRYHGPTHTWILSLKSLIVVWLLVMLSPHSHISLLLSFPLISQTIPLA